MFDKYTGKLKELANQTFAQRISAEHELAEAQKDAGRYPLFAGKGVIETDERYEKALAAQTRLTKAQAAQKRAADAMQSALREMRQMQKELAAAALDEFLPYGKDIDADDLRVLESGILTPPELERMYEVATKTGNEAMRRLIGKAAAEAAERLDGMDGRADDAAKMRALAYDAQESRAERFTEAFGGLVDIYDQMAYNPQIIDRWAEFTNPLFALFD